eukprot:1083544-Pelagomonas_calceolata.AAC.1
MPTLIFVAHWEPNHQQLSTMLLPTSESARNSCFPATPGAYKLSLSGILQQESAKYTSEDK